MTTNNNIPRVNKAYFYTVDGLKTKLQQINNDLDKLYDEAPLDEIDPEELNDIIYKLEISALSCRYAVATSKYPQLETDVSLEELASMNYPVTVEFNNKTLTVTTPIVFRNYHDKKNMVRNFMLASYVEYALKRWQNGSKTDLKQMIECPLVVIMQRCGYKWSNSKYCDNDNLESSKIINKIVIDGLGYSDNARNMTIITTFKQVDSPEEDCTKFIIFGRSNLTDHMHEI